MRKCGRIGCENTLDDARPDAVYCGPTCKREAARARALSRDETGKPGFWSRYSQIRRPRRCTTRDTAVAAVIASLLLLAGCGGTKTVTVTRTVTNPKVTLPSPAPNPKLPPCPTSATAAGYYMQCALLQPAAVPPPPLGLGPLTISQSGFGIDFAWGGPSGFTARASGAHFGASYLSRSSKDWTLGTMRSYLNAGLGVIFVWESSAARSLDGWSAGYNDAYNATWELRNRLGVSPKGVHVDFASDYDTSVYGSRFVSYYQGASSWMHRAGGTPGAYGGLHTVDTLCADHVTILNWQTVAWSGGRRASTACAPLYQRSINNSLAGSSVDNDYAYAANYGQLGYKAKPSNLQHYERYPNVYWRLRGRRIRERAVVQRWDRRRCSNPTRRSVCNTAWKDLSLLAARDFTVAHRTPNLKHRAKRPRWGQHHLGGRYQGLEHRLHGRGVVKRWA